MEKGGDSGEQRGSEKARQRARGRRSGGEGEQCRNGEMRGN